MNTMQSPSTLSKFGFDVESRSYRRNFSKYENHNVSQAIERYESYERHKKKLNEIENSASPLRAKRVNV